MSQFDFNTWLDTPLNAFDFRTMIGDVKDFLEFSELNLDWQFRRELQMISASNAEDYEPGERDALQESVEHRFQVSLPLKVRYGALISFITSVEWAMQILTEKAINKPPKPPVQRNITVHRLAELGSYAGLDVNRPVADFEALVIVRNCIVHSAGIEEQYKYRDSLAAAIDRLDGFSIDQWHFFGKHICISRCALEPYIENMTQVFVEIHRKTLEVSRRK